jgi:TonB-dependent SusC/RagA subfamily outer membrane receptor
MMTKRKKTIRAILLICLLSGLTNVAHSAVTYNTVTTEVQQSINLSGEVTDVNGEPLIGVNVTAQGSSAGTMTDADGKFGIDANHGDVLQFSYVGYTTQTVVVNNGKILSIVLEEDRTMLEEIVVVGYGTQKKVNLTGAVAQITSKELENRPVTTVSQMIQGAMPNVQISINTGAPGEGGSIQIRGTGSLNGSEPLILVDGIPRRLNRLNLSDVESISVLKDTASSAIYGARGAFGIILVTTKKAKAGKTRISYDGFRNTTGMLVSGLTVPAIFGADSPQQNAGDMRTNGFELVIGWKDRVKVGGKPLNYSINLSLGDATSEVTKYEANDNKLVSTWGKIRDGRNNKQDIV